MEKLVLLSILLLPGCANLYGYVGGGYGTYDAYYFITKPDGIREYFDIDCVIGVYGTGIDLTDNLAIEYAHRSCLNPNVKAEVPTNDIIVKYKFGGK